MSLYIGSCKQCSKTYISQFEPQTQRMSEEHMMTTGHVVEIEEY